MAWPSTVDLLQDGVSTLDADTLNPIITALTDRTQFLLDQSQLVTNKSIVTALAQPVSSAGALVKGDVVYYEYADTATSGLKVAYPSVKTATVAPFLRSGDSSYIFGIVSDNAAQSDVVDVYLQGLISEKDIVLSLLTTKDVTDITLGTTGYFTGGPLFLSKTQPGKLTPNPAGLAIFVGFAKNLDEFYLNPGKEVLSEFFINYSFDLLPRPIGTPTFAAGVWTINSPDTTNKIGWVPAASSGVTLPTFGAETPKYFYHIPAIDDLATHNPELTEAEILNAAQMQLVFPANPVALSHLTINGMVQTYKTEEGDGGYYYLDSYGLWLFDYSTVTDPEVTQPWASDLNTSISFLCGSGGDVSTAAGTITIIGHGFANGDIVKLIVADPSIGNISYNTAYYVVSSATNTFRLANTPNGTPLSITDDGTDGMRGYIEWLPAYWDFAQGTSYFVPKIKLQISKLNPDLKSVVVTSLRPKLTTLPSIEFTDYVAGTTATKGDLTARIVINTDEKGTNLNSDFAGLATGNYEGSAVKALYYNKEEEKLKLYSGPCISEVRAGVGGLTATTDLNTGVATISYNSAANNLITSIEPEQARLEFYGLNSYLSLDYTSVPCGLVGKFMLPNSLSALASTGYVYIKMLVFGKSNVTSSNVNIPLKFEYAISELSSILTSTISTALTGTLVLSTSYVGYSYFETTAASFAGSVYLCKIPASVLKAKSMVNFRIQRLKTGASLYTGSLGIVGLYWTLDTP